ncbi:unnamed protein product [Ambrosiozyma monospora]|uniref:Unnamed protein product n=1 Tax=Ambrosiozyma monospora TaxID=43982 RepID=A0A9W6YXM2_AMBMO|nr:unnamed protein product [Ambrosiozyma monospora]
MKSFLLVSMVFAVLILTLEAFLFGVYLANIGSINYIKDDGKDTHNNSHEWVVTKRNAVATYLALYIYAEIYQVVLALITIYTRNIYHLVSSVGFLAAMCAYSGVQYSELHKTLINAEHQNWQTICQAISIAIIVIAVVLVINQAAIAWQLKDIFIQHTGEKTGMNTNLIKANMFFNLHRNAVILSFFFFPAFTLQFIVIALKRNDPEFIITVIVLVLSLFLLLLADFCATRELLFPLLVLIVFYLGAIAYLLFKLIRLFTKYANQPGKRSLVVFDIFTLLLAFWLATITVVVISNFGKGLKKLYANNYSRHGVPIYPTMTQNSEISKVSARKYTASGGDLYNPVAPPPREQLDF